MSATAGVRFATHTARWGVCLAWLGAAGCTVYAPQEIDPDLASATLSANVVEVPADGVQGATVTLAVQLRGGAPASNVTVLFATDSNGPFVLSTTNTVTNPQGVAVTTVRGLAPGVVQVVASLVIGGTSLRVDAPLSITFTAVSGGSATTSTTGTGGSGTTTTGTTLTTGTTGATTTGGTTTSGTTTGALTTTGTTGGTTTSGTTTGAPTTTGTTTGTTGGTTTGGTTGTPSASNSSITANPTSGIIANGTTTSLITVTLRDSLGNAVPAYPLSVTASDTSVPAFIAPLTTDANGVATVPLTSTFAGPKTVVAHASIVLTASVTFVSNPAACPGPVVLAGVPPAVRGIVASYQLQTIDLNRDGILDLVVADFQGNAAGVAIGMGNAQFQPAQPYSSGNGPTYVAVCDLNHDSNQDIAVVNQTSATLGVYLGDGHGGLVAKPSIVVGSTLAAAVLDCTDMNKDGNPDLILNLFNVPYGIDVFLGSGNGNFLAPINTPLSNTPWGMSVGDINQDTNQDVVVVDGSSSVYVLTGKGNGQLNAPATYGVGSHPSYVGIQDLNHDGYPELVTTNYTPGTLTVLRSTHGTSFSTAQTVPVRNGCNSVAFADFNQDSNMDLVTQDNVNLVYVALGTGGATFGTPVPYPAGERPNFVVTADVNGDTFSDVLCSDKGGAGVSILLGKGDGTLYAAPRYAIGSTPTAIAAGDVTGDGNVDLVTGNQNTVSVLVGMGGGAFATAVSYSLPATVSELILADVTHDGRLDVVGSVATGVGGVVVLPNQGNGVFNGVAASYPTGAPAMGVDVGDFNSDGVLDVVTGMGNTNAVSVLLGQASGGFSLSAPYYVGLAGATAARVQVTDFNQDGNQDLVVALNGNEIIGVLFGQGNGTFAGGSTYAPSTLGYQGFQDVTVADFNLNGFPGVAGLDAFNTTNPNTQINVWSGSSTGVLTQASNSNLLASRYMALRAADLNGDGMPDLLAPSYSTASFSLWYGNGTGTFQSPQAYPCGNDPNGLVAADFNGDGHQDVAVANSNDNTVSVYLFSQCQ